MDRQSNDMDETERGSRKKGKKDKGYSNLERASSEEELVSAGLSHKQSVKSKKGHKVFGKLAGSKSKDKKKKRDEDSPTNGSNRSPSPILSPVFGQSLDTGNRNNPSHDGVPIPAFVRKCLDFIGQHGLREEGIYRISAPKSRVDALQHSVETKGELVGLGQPGDTHAAAGLLKLYLRSLPGNILTELFHPKFESAAGECHCDLTSGKCTCLSGDRILAVLQRLPPANYHLLAYLFLHMRLVIRNERFNKMSVSSLGLVLSATLSFSHRLFAILLQNTHSDQKEATSLFKDVTLRRYIGPLRPAPDRLAQDLPSTRAGIEEELKKQQSLLRQLHDQLETMRAYVGGGGGGDRKLDQQKAQELWDVQMVETQLKRRLKTVMKEAGDPVEEEEEEDPGPSLELFEEKQLLAVQTELKERIAAEKKMIRELEAGILAAGEQPVTADGWVSEDEDGDALSEEDRNRTEDGWKEELKKEELRREKLLTDIIEERNRCASIRAQIEHIEIQRERKLKAAEAKKAAVVR